MENFVGLNRDKIDIGRRRSLSLLFRTWVLFFFFFFARPEHQIHQKEEFRTDIESYRPTRPLGTLTNKSHAMQKDTDIDMVDDNFQSKHKSSGF